MIENRLRYLAKSLRARIEWEAHDYYDTPIESQLKDLKIDIYKELASEIEEALDAPEDQILKSLEESSDG